ncbi:hypothetical protein K1W54_31210 [Micromonospora sp. CPCC 205371]|nr:hypothetical protein [Micromonospora sp. CPCC 205371]
MGESLIGGPLAILKKGPAQRCAGRNPRATRGEEGVVEAGCEALRSTSDASAAAPSADSRTRLPETAIKEDRIDQGRMHAEKRSNRVHSPLIGAERGRRAASAGGLVGDVGDV